MPWYLIFGIKRKASTRLTGSACSSWETPVTLLRPIDDTSPPLGPDGSHALPPRAPHSGMWARLPPLPPLADESPPPPPPLLPPRTRPGGSGGSAVGDVAATAGIAPPAEEDANKGRAEGWHRRRGAAVGPTLVLACALRATCLKRGGRAYCSPPNSSGDVPPTPNPQFGGGGSPQLPAGGVEGLTLAPLVNVMYMSGTFGGGPVAAKEPPALLQLVVGRIGDEVCFLRQGFEKPSLLRLLLRHLSDQVVIQV